MITFGICLLSVWGLYTTFKLGQSHIWVRYYRDIMIRQADEIKELQDKLNAQMNHIVSLERNLEDNGN